MNPKLYAVKQIIQNLLIEVMGLCLERPSVVACCWFYLAQLRSNTIWLGHLRQDNSCALLKKNVCTCMILADL